MASEIPKYPTKITVQDLQQTNNKEAYKREKKCYNCGDKFGKIGIIHAKKHMCRFCFHAFCAKCSEQSIIHPISKTQERICDQCMEMIIIKHKQIEVTPTVRASLRASMSMSISSPEMGRLQSELYQVVELKTKLIKDKENLENQAKQLQEDIEQMQEHKQRLIQQQEELKGQLEERKNEIFAVQQKIQNLNYDWEQDINEKVLVYKEKNKNLQEEIDSMKETTDVLGHLRDKFDKLNKERDSLIDATSERKSGACCLIF